MADEMLFSGATYPPPSRDPGRWGGPPMLFWAVRSSCGGRLGWGVFRPKLGRGRGQKGACPWAGIGEYMAASGRGGRAVESGGLISKIEG